MRHVYYFIRFYLRPGTQGSSGCEAGREVGQVCMCAVAGLCSSLKTAHRLPLFCFLLIFGRLPNHILFMASEQKLSFACTLK